jgi:hypothetical protein
LRVLDWFRHQNQEKIYCGNRDASEIDAEGAMARVAQSGGVNGPYSKSHGKPMKIFR